jgi:hypothetical protein
MLAITGWFLWVIIDESFPALADADRLKAGVNKAIDQALEAHIQAGHIPAAHQNAHSSAHLDRSLPVPFDSIVPEARPIFIILCSSKV